MAKRQFRFGIDPGLINCGWACFEGGVCIETGTLHPPAKGTLVERYLWLIDALEVLFSRFENLGVIAEIAVERFVDYVPSKKASSLLKTSDVRGICLCMARHWAQKITEVCKEGAPKTEAVMLCRALKIKADSQDAADAVHFCLLAGFDRKEI